MKPDWKDAPEGMNFLAQDANGKWFWHQTEPFASESSGGWDCDDDVDYAGVSDIDGQWWNTLERRP